MHPFWVVGAGVAPLRVDPAGGGGERELELGTRLLTPSTDYWKLFLKALFKPRTDLVGDAVSGGPQTPKLRMDPQREIVVRVSVLMGSSRGRL